jgi:hypothetical protein
MENVDNLEIITRKSVYFYLREICGLPTKKIVLVLTRLRKRYSVLKQDWFNQII